MKKLNKLFTLIIALVCVLMFSLVGCSEEDKAKYKALAELNGKSTQEIYTDIMSDIASIKNNFTATIIYDMPCTMSVSVGGFSMSNTMNMQTTTTFMMDGDSFYEKDIMYVESETESAQTLVVEAWLVNDYAYISSEGTKIKYQANLEALANYLGKGIDELWNPIYDFSATAFDDVKFYVNSNNSSDVYFELVLSGAEAAAFAKENLGDLSEYEEADINFGDISYKFIITEEGKLEDVKVSYNVSINLVEDDMSMFIQYTCSGYIRFSNIGTTVINAPVDANSYLYYGSILPSA